ncbi:MAG: stage II sporulation protein M [Dehalococcoidales bacterium]|nr:stage II sporulation protein M [Dehalococcoidales bacterium]
MNNYQEIPKEKIPTVSFWQRFPEIGYKKWIIIASLVFLLGLLIGAINPNIGILEDYIEELADSLGPLSSSDILIVILLNNIFTLLISFIFSPVLCILPLLSLFINGWLLSVFGYLIIQQEPLGYYLLGILPHGILEIPALILGQAAALSLGVMTIIAVINKEKRGWLLPNLRRNIKYLFIALLLLVPAAVIETYITPLLLNNLNNI